MALKKSIALRACLRRATWFASVCLVLVTIPGYGVEHAQITVDGSGVATIPAGRGTSGFTLRGSGTTGVIPIQIGPIATDDATSGILISSVSEMGRDVATSTGGTERLWASPSISRNPSGELSIATHKAGVDQPDTLFPNAAHLDADVNAAYFPFSEGWVGGTVYANQSGIFDDFILNGLSPGDVQQDKIVVGSSSLDAGGLSTITIPGVVDTRRQGIFLATSAEDNNVFAMTNQMSDGSAFTLQTALNNANGPTRVGGESASFVFLPLGTPNLTLARLHTGHENHAPEALISSGDAITVVREAPGRVRLSIAGQSPSTGTLLLNQHGSHDDLEPNPSGGRSTDNLPSFVADGNDWIILSEDLSDTDPIDGKVDGMADNFPQGQDPNAHGSYFDLAFIPFDNPPTGPGPIPDVSTLTGFNRSRVIGWNMEVTAYSNDNGPGGMRADATSSSTGISVSGIGSNRGDLSFYVDGANLASAEGVMLATVSEGLRDNSSLLGEFDYGLVNTTNQFSNKWAVATAAAGTGREHNINVSVAFFGADAGFETGTLIDSNNGTGHIDVLLPDVNSLTDGVLMASPWGNDNNFVTVTPKTDGSGWDLDVSNFNTSPEGSAGVYSDGVNYVYLPYETENLIAGRVNPDGSLVNSTDPGDFTLTKQGTGEYLLKIAGRTFDDGMLLLNATADGASADNSLVYERSGDDFLVIGLDMVPTSTELVDPEDTAFSFAFVDFLSDLTAPSTGLAGDFDNDGDADGADFLAWQRGFPATFSAGDLADWQGNFGVAANAAAGEAVPEPTTAAALLIAASMGVVALQRRRELI